MSDYSLPGALAAADVASAKQQSAAADARGGGGGTEVFVSYRAKLQCEQDRDPALSAMRYGALAAAPTAAGASPPAASDGQELTQGGGGAAQPLAAVGILTSASHDDRLVGVPNRINQHGWLVG